MYINDINIMYYVLVGIIGLFVGQFVDWCNIRLPEYKKVFSKEFYIIYLKNTKPKYLLAFTTAHPLLLETIISNSIIQSFNSSVAVPHLLSII